MGKTSKYYKNPIIIFSIIGLLSGFFILFKMHFQIPNVYTDIAAAQQAALLPDRDETYKILEKLTNNYFPLYNTIFHMFFSALILIAICWILKIKNFSDIFKNKILKNPKFAYLWINTTYPLYGIVWTIAYMTNESCYVRHMHEDSMGIPLFATIFTMSFLALIYYPVMNFILYAIYNLKTYKKRYIIITFFALIYFIQTLLGTYTFRFNYWTLPLFLYLFITIILLMTGIFTITKRR